MKKSKEYITHVRTALDVLALAWPGIITGTYFGAVVITGSAELQDLGYVDVEEDEYPVSKLAARYAQGLVNLAICVANDTAWGDPPYGVLALPPFRNDARLQEEICRCVMGLFNLKGEVACL